ncbi:hypothetical protein OB920_11125 [Halobacteria archaeon HArc-gm2]|nr:hypothetical protein [Halobacteria archaeon HArc-gm2]
MGTLTVDDQTLSFEQIARGEADQRFVLVVEYRGAAGLESATVDLDVTSRRDATKGVIEDALTAWYEGQSEVTVESFEVVERIECRRGDALDRGEDPADEPEVEPIDGPEPGVDADALAEGDRVAYYVEGPHSAVYGYIAEGVVEKVPPWHRGVPGQGELIADRAVLDVGDRTREVPLEWIIGSTADSTVADAVDRPYPA